MRPYHGPQSVDTRHLLRVVGPGRPSQLNEQRADDRLRGERVVRCSTGAVARRPTSASRGSTCASSGLCSRQPARGLTTECVALQQRGPTGRDNKSNRAASTPHTLRRRRKQARGLRWPQCYFDEPVPGEGLLAQGRLAVVATMVDGLLHVFGPSAALLARARIWRLAVEQRRQLGPRGLLGRVSVGQPRSQPREDLCAVACRRLFEQHGGVC